jgi:hypothetical protein
MDSSSARVLILAHKTAATPALIEAVRERASRGPCRFTLLVPRPAHGLHRLIDPEDQADDEARRVLDNALPLLSDAARSAVEGLLGDPAPLTAVEDAINLHGFDEIIVSTLPAHLSRWLKLDLPSKIGGLGLPVTTVTGKDDAHFQAAT